MEIKSTRNQRRYASSCITSDFFFHPSRHIFSCQKGKSYCMNTTGELRERVERGRGSLLRVLEKVRSPAFIENNAMLSGVLEE